jgi:hypothetical protein
MPSPRDALIILNPRQIPECIRSMQQQDIDRLWASYMDEPTAAARIMDAVAADPHHDRYVIVSDDVVVTRRALDAVLDLQGPDMSVTTGYCNLDRRSPYCNLTANRLSPPPPSRGSYKFMRTATVRRATEPVLTSFAGLALTCLDRDTLLRYGLYPTSAGRSMDYTLSYDLQTAGIPIYAPAAGFVHHVKEVWNRLDKAPEKRLLIGERQPELRWELIDRG